MFSLLIDTAAAQSTQAAPAAQNPIMSMIPLVLVFLVFYFLMLRPQKKKLEEEQAYLKKLQVGDDIFTKSGILGKVQGISSKVITLEVENGGRIKVLKSHIGGSSKKLLEEKPVKK